MSRLQHDKLEHDHHMIIMGKGMIKIVTLDFYLQFKENALRGSKACYNIVGEVHFNSK